MNMNSWLLGDQDDPDDIYTTGREDGMSMYE
jgi:hypothetical protein